MSLAFEFVGAIFLFWFVGRLLDDRFGTEPWIQVVGALIGWGGGFLHVYYRTKGVAWEGVPGTRRPAATATSRTESEAATRSRNESEAANGAKASRKVYAAQRNNESRGTEAGGRAGDRAGDDDGLGGQR